MRKLILGVSSMMVIGIISCNKKEVKEIDTGLKKNEALTTSKQANVWGICCVWNGVDNCVPPPVNCFGEVIVKPKYTEAYMSFNELNTIVNGTSKINSIVSFFSENGGYKNLFPGLDNEENSLYLSKLRSGNYYIDIVERGNRNSYLVKLNGTNYADFVLVVKKEGNGNN